MSPTTTVQVLLCQSDLLSGSVLAPCETGWALKVQPDGGAAAASTCSTGLCVSERVTQASLNPAQTAARTSTVTPGPGLISYLRLYRHSERALFYYYCTGEI